MKGTNNGLCPRPRGDIRWRIEIRRCNPVNTEEDRRSLVMDRTFLLCLICFTVFSFGVCGPTDKRGPKDLSDEHHFEGKEHNLQYDHEAFLGKEEAKEFDKLSPEESKRRLGLVTIQCFSLVEPLRLLLPASFPQCNSRQDRRWPRWFHFPWRTGKLD